jgi:hypothetical protein
MQRTSFYSHFADINFLYKDKINQPYDSTDPDFTYCFHERTEVVHPTTNSPYPPSPTLRKFLSRAAVKIFLIPMVAGIAWKVLMKFPLSVVADFVRLLTVVFVLHQALELHRNILFVLMPFLLLVLWYQNKSSTLTPQRTEAVLTNLLKFLSHTSYSKQIPNSIISPGPIRRAFPFKLNQDCWLLAWSF